MAGNEHETEKIVSDVVLVLYGFELRHAHLLLRRQLMQTRRESDWVCRQGLVVQFQLDTVLPAEFLQELFLRGRQIALALRLNCDVLWNGGEFDKECCARPTVGGRLDADLTPMCSYDCLADR